MRGPLYVAASASLWGLWSLFFKTAERAALHAPLSAQAESVIIVIVMMAVLLPVGMRDRALAPRRLGSEWVRVAAIGVFDALNILCFLTAMQKTTIAVAVLTHYLAPLLIALFAPIALGERWQVRTLLALGVASSGMVLLLQPWSSVWSAPGTEEGLALGAFLGALSAVLYAASVLLQKKLVLRFSSFELAAFTKPAAAVVLLLALPSPGALAVGVVPWAILVVGGLLCGALPAVMFFVGLKTTAASRASVLTLCEPLVAVLVGVFVWHEPLGALGALGGVLILLGAGLVGATGSDPKAGSSLAAASCDG